MSDPTPEKPKGLRCPVCGCPRSTVTNTRYPTAGRVVRYRVCAHCAARFTSREVFVCVTRRGENP